MTVALDETPVDPSGTITINLATRSGAGDPAAVRLSQPGVYPVVVELQDDEGAALAQFVTHIVRLPVADPEAIPLRVAVTVPVHAPPALQPDGSVSRRRAGPGGHRHRRRRPAALPRPCRSPSSRRRKPSHRSAPIRPHRTPGSLEAVRRGAQGRQVLAGPYVDLEPAAWLQSGGLTTLAANSTTAWPRSPTASAASTPAPRSPIPRSTRPRRRGCATVASPVSSCPRRRWNRSTPTTFPVTLAQGFLVDGVDGIEAAMADDALAGHVGESGDPVLDAHHLLGDLTVLHLDEPPAERGVVVDLPDTAAPRPGAAVDHDRRHGRHPRRYGRSRSRPSSTRCRWPRPTAGTTARATGFGAELTPVPAADLGALPEALAANPRPTSTASSPPSAHPASWAIRSTGDSWSPPPVS